MKTLLIFVVIFFSLQSLAATRPQTSAMKKSSAQKRILRKKLVKKTLQKKKTHLKKRVRKKRVHYKKRRPNKTIHHKQAGQRKHIQPRHNKESVPTYKAYMSRRKLLKPRFSPPPRNGQFDLPIAYNKEVQRWIQFFQTRGRRWFKNRLERASKYLPRMQLALRRKGLPQDLAMLPMIESGFSAHAVSSASAVGYWQFIQATANRYGLKTNWWIDERRDFIKSTDAASNYLGDLYGLFRSWHLSAAAYNMGEHRLERLIKKYRTTDFWTLAQKRDFPKETREYIPKLIAVLLISKNPSYYGFHNIRPMNPYRYDYFFAPGGTDLHNMASALNISKDYLKSLNPELTLGFIPESISAHKIRVPKGFTAKVSSYLRSLRL